MTSVIFTVAVVFVIWGAAIAILAPLIGSILRRRRRESILIPPMPQGSLPEKRRSF